MLVISRKVGERIQIGDDIEISILEIEEGRLKIGIEAPRSIKIVRSELMDAIREENQIAMTESTNSWLGFMNQFGFNMSNPSVKIGDEIE